MQQAFDSSAQVKDDLPTLRSELGSWWEDHLKPLVDFKSFLRQRRAILTNRDLAHSTSPPFEGWKNPFNFALSATTLTFTAVALIGLGFHTLFPDPDLKNDWIARNLQTRVKAVEARLAHTHRTSSAYADLTAERDRLRSDLDDHTSGLTDPHEGVILTAGTPLVVYFLGALFPLFIHRKMGGAKYASAAREAVYYYFTARTFWPAFLLVTGGAIFFFLLKYSLLNIYDELPQSFPVSGGPLYFLLATVATLGAIAFFYALAATPIAIHKCGREMAAVLGANDDPPARRAIYWGLVGTILSASIFALVLTLVLIVGYSMFDSASQSVRTAIGTSISAAPTAR